MPHVILDCELGGPHGQFPPVVAIHAVVGHAGVDVVGDAGLFGGISTGFANGDFITPMGGVDEGNLRTGEQSVQDGSSCGTGQVALDDVDMGEFCEFLGDESVTAPDLSPDMPAHGSSSADERGGLSAGGVDGGNGFCSHHKSDRMETAWELGRERRQAVGRSVVRWCKSP